jgi:hypothetical protein
MDELDPATKVGIGGGGVLAAILGRSAYLWFRRLLAEWRRIREERREERAGHIAELQRQVAALEGQLSGLRKHYESRLSDLGTKLDAEVKARSDLALELERERSEHKRTRDANAELAGIVAEQKQREAALEARLMARVRELEGELRGRDKALAEMLQRAIETVLAKREGA